jgi:hypothetical protein
MDGIGQEKVRNIVNIKFMVCSGVVTAKLGKNTFNHVITCVIQIVVEISCSN